jgi:hypothetical protein
MIPATNESIAIARALKNETLTFPLHKHLTRKPRLHPRTKKMLDQISKNLIDEGLEHMVPEKVRAEMLKGLKAE